MTAEKKKVYGNMRIMAIQGKDLFRTEAITALKNGKLNTDKFDGIIDESLDTDKLCEVYKAHEAKIGYIAGFLFSNSADSFTYGTVYEKRVGYRHSANRFGTRVVFVADLGLD